ncbi:hypothetical protein [Candidatus Venteria ishoeyi]|uniref:hypothetical protein n=1 Tax=Candidatus Venteria ishoeyi TaxID=1899563 RepID=UPI0011B09424|nr:hypothetical protein [Candidatus Venteria ishoeyi]
MSDIDACSKQYGLEIGGINRHLSAMCDTTQDMLELPADSRINASFNGRALYLNPLQLAEDSYLKAKFCAFPVESDYFFKLVTLEGPVAVVPASTDCTMADGATSGTTTDGVTCNLNP